MATISFATQQAADTRSREWWTTILGRSKNPGDVTEYLYGRVPLVEGGEPLAIDIPARDAHLDKLLREDKMTNAEMLALVALYPAWSESSVAYAIGAVVAHGGALYKCVQAHTSQQSWTPTATPALWTRTAPDNVIPTWVQPTGAHDAYALEAKVTYNRQVWQSTVNANVWQPGVFGWVVV